MPYHRFCGPLPCCHFHLTKHNHHTDTSEGDKEATCILQNHPQCNKTTSPWVTPEAKKIWAASPCSIKEKVAYSCLSDRSPWDSPDVLLKPKYIGFKKRKSYSFSSCCGHILYVIMLSFVQ